MFSKTIAVAATLATIASAAPAPQSQAPAGGVFSLVTIRSGSEVQNQPLTASQGNLWLNRAQNASCDSPQQSASFTLNDGALYLYAASATPQQLYVDRSGMGQGKTGYTTGAQPAPRNAERTGWSFSDRGYLQFANSTAFQVCPTGFPDGSYSLWVGSGSNPGWNSNCTSVGIAAFEITDPVSCSYTSN